MKPVLTPALRVISTPVTKMFVRLALAMSKSNTIYGIQLVDMTMNARGPDAFVRLREVVELIARYDAPLLRQLTRDVRRIVIMLAGGPAYRPHMQACVLDLKFVLTGAAEGVALALAHEATHARIHRRGIKYSPENRARIERLCVEREITLARRLPNSAGFRIQAENRLGQVWWTEDHIADRRAAIANAYGVPKWLARFSRVLD